MKQIKIFFLIIILILFSLNIFCAEFTADLIKNEGGIKTIGKIYVKGNKIRIDSEQNGEKSIMLNDYDNNQFLILQPSSKIYISINLDNQIDFSDPDFKEKNKDITDIKIIGQEKINGYLCDKYQYSYHDKKIGKLTVWYSKKLKYTLKMVYESNSPMKIELSKIHEKNLDPNLFIVPSDYQKIIGF